MKGFGTDEKMLIRTLCDKDALQIEVIKSAYQRNHGGDLMERVKKETSGHLETGLLKILHGPLMSDVVGLHDAIAGMGTKEWALNDILLSRSNADMNAIKGAYLRTYNRKLEDHLSGDLSGKAKKHFIIVLCASRAEYSAPAIPTDVDRDVLDLYKATEGKVGTDELLVSSILSTRNDNQLRAIAQAYIQKFGTSLDKVIQRVCILSMPTHRIRPTNLFSNRSFLVT